MTQIGTIGTALAVALLGACASDDEPDARIIPNFPDAPPAVVIDAAPPSLDAPPPTFGATISVQEIAVLEKSGTTVVPSTAAPGTGGNINISFTQTNLPNAAFIDTGVGIPCTATRYDGTAGTPAPAILNEGTVNIAVVGGATIPPCAFVGGGYRCIGAQGTGGTGAAVSASVWTLTDTTGTSQLTAADTGRFLVFAANPAAAFPILGFTAPNLLNLGGPVQATVPAFFTVAGVGPVPTVFNPGGAPTGVPPEFLTNDSTVTVTFVPSGTAHLAAFTSAALNAGDAWTLDDASKAVLAEGVLVHSGSVTIGCSGTGGTCGTSTGTIVAIDSTDVAPTGATDFPAPTAKTTNITCTKLGTESIVLTAAQIQLLKDASPTRLRISVFRVGADLALFATRGVGVVAGQGFVKFEDAP